MKDNCYIDMRARQTSLLEGKVSVTHWGEDKEPPVYTVDKPRSPGPTETNLAHPNSIRFKAILKEMAALHDKKAKDYGTGTDPLANVKASAGFGVPAWVGVLIRMNDKMIRLQSLCQKGYLANESAEDSLRDLAVYSIIALILREEEVKNGQV